MLALRKTNAAPGTELREVARPVPTAGEVLVAVEAAGICGTDVHIAAWTPGYEAMAAVMPVTLGHEFSGRVVAPAADGAGPPPGQLVTVRPSVVCGRCAACAAGRPDDCTGRRGIGITRDGAFAPFVAVPAANCVAVPDGLDPEIAALTEPMTVCAEAVATGEVRPGDRVLVIGPGTIGQGIALFAEHAGARQVVVAGRDDAARFETLRRLGFQDLVDTRGATLSEALRPHLAEGRFDVVVEAAGVPALVPEALGLLRKRGILVICGIHPRPAEIDLTRLVREHQQVRGSYRAPVETWAGVLGVLAADPERARHLISHRLALAEAPRGFDLATRRLASKVILTIGEEARHAA